MHDSQSTRLLPPADWRLPPTQRQHHHTFEVTSQLIEFRNAYTDGREVIRRDEFYLKDKVQDRDSPLTSPPDYTFLNIQKMPLFKRLLEGREITKLTLNIYGEMWGLKIHYNLGVLQGSDFNCLHQAQGMNELVKQYLGREIDKSPRNTDWAVSHLHLSKVHYAALDAWLLLAVRERQLQMPPSVSLPKPTAKLTSHRNQFESKPSSIVTSRKQNLQIETLKSSWNLEHKIVNRSIRSPKHTTNLTHSTSRSRGPSRSCSPSSISASSFSSDSAAMSSPRRRRIRVPRGSRRRNSSSSTISSSFSSLSTRSVTSSSSSDTRINHASRRGRRKNSKKDRHLANFSSDTKRKFTYSKKSRKDFTSRSPTLRKKVYSPSRGSWRHQDTRVLSSIPERSAWMTSSSSVVISESENGSKDISRRSTSSSLARERDSPSRKTLRSSSMKSLRYSLSMKLTSLACRLTCDQLNVNHQRSAG